MNDPMHAKKEHMKLQMKAFLYDLADKSEDPARELEDLIAAAISELYWDAKAALEARKGHLRVISE